jgi:hypothetical protein
MVFTFQPVAFSIILKIKAILYTYVYIHDLKI